MSDHRKSSQGNDLHADDLHVKAEQDRTGTTIILEGEFDMTGTGRFWAFFSEALAASPRSITLNAAGVTSSIRLASWLCTVPVLRPMKPVYRSVSPSHRLNCGVQHRLGAPKICSPTDEAVDAQRPP
jgi:hypothetical protein